MRRLAWSQLRFRAGRALALLAGILVAATAFTVLTAAARTAQIRTIGTVSAHFRPAYDILVRPAGARSKLESATGTVQPDFLSGIYGGITMAQYHQIQQISGVSVAAPIAMVGYGFMNADLPGLAARGRRVPAGPAGTVSGEHDLGERGRRQPDQAAALVRLRHAKQGPVPQPDPGHQRAPAGRLGRGAVPGRGPAEHSPFSYHALRGVSCFSKVNGEGVPPGTFFFPNFHVPPGLRGQLAVPDAAGRGQPSRRGASWTASATRWRSATTCRRPTAMGVAWTTPTWKATGYPVLAATDSGIGEYAQNQVQELATPAAPPVLNTAAMRRDATLPGHPVLSTTTTARQAYGSCWQPAGRGLAPRSASRPGRTGPPTVRYRRASDGDLVPETVPNPVSAWGTGPSKLLYPPLDNAGTQYRTLRQHAITAQNTISPTPVLDGTFDQRRIAAFDPLSRVPLGPYQPTVARPANAASGRPWAAGTCCPA